MPSVMTEYARQGNTGYLRITRTDLSGEGAVQSSSTLPERQSVLGTFLALTGLRSLVIYSK